MSDTAGSRNDGTVDRLLREAGFDDDAALRSALLDLQGLAAGQPQASAAVAALMAPPPAVRAEQAVRAKRAGQTDRAAQSTATTRLAAVPDAASSPQPEAGDLEAGDLAAGDRAALDLAAPAPAAAQPAPGSPAAVTDELAARRRAKRRITLTTLSLAASLAAGGAVAVASDQGIRDSFGQLHHAVASFVATAGGGPAPVPVETPAPAPAQPGSPASVPAAPASTAPATAAPETGNSQAPKHTTTPTHPATVPLPDLPVPGNVTPGVPGGPLNGEGQPPTLPLPATPPVPVPSIHP